MYGSWWWYLGYAIEFDGDIDREAIKKNREREAKDSLARISSALYTTLPLLRSLLPNHLDVPRLRKWPWGVRVYGIRRRR